MRRISNGEILRAIRAWHVDYGFGPLGLDLLALWMDPHHPPSKSILSPRIRSLLDHGYLAGHVTWKCPTCGRMNVDLYDAKWPICEWSVDCPTLKWGEIKWSVATPTLALTPKGMLEADID